MLIQQRGTQKRQNGNDVLYDDDDDDDDELYGDDDELYGDEGDDILVSGKGDDILIGGTGNNTYLFNRGNGENYIYAESYDESGNDTLRFGADIVVDEIHLTRVNQHLIISVGDGADRVVVIDYFSDTAPLLRQIIFVDGMVWDTPAIIDHLPVDSGRNWLPAKKAQA